MTTKQRYQGLNIFFRLEHEELGHTVTTKTEPLNRMLSKIMESDDPVEIKWRDDWPLYSEGYLEDIEAGTAKEDADFEISRAWISKECSCGEDTDPDLWTFM